MPGVSLFFLPMILTPLGAGRSFVPNRYRSGQLQIAWDVEYLFRRLLIPFTDEHRRILEDLILKQGLSPEERTLFKRRLDQNPMQRLKLPFYSLNVIDEAWADTHSQVCFPLLFIICTPELSHRLTRSGTRQPWHSLRHSGYLPLGARPR